MEGAQNAVLKKSKIEFKTLQSPSWKSEKLEEVKTKRVKSRNGGKQIKSKHLGCA